VLPLFRAHAIVLRGWALVEQASEKRASPSLAKGSQPIARPERSLNWAGGPKRATCGRPFTAGSPRGSKLPTLKEAKTLLDELT
jgi:hypothetical protein